MMDELVKAMRSCSLDTLQVVEQRLERRIERNGCEILERAQVPGEIDVGVGINGGMMELDQVRNLEQLIDKHGDFLMVLRTLKLLRQESSVLRDRGDFCVLAAATTNGDSIMCELCHGLVPTTRMDEHRQFWCARTLNEPEETQAKMEEG